MTATQLKTSTPTTEQNAQRDALITEHLHLVTAIAAHVQGSIPVHIELDDLIHAGTMGLFDAATKYRDDKEVAFASYAKHRIRGAIIDSLRQQDWASRDLRKRYKQMETVTIELTTKLGRTPTEAEIAGEMGLSTRRWQSLMVDFRSMNAAATQNHAHEDEEQITPEIPDSAAHSPERLFARAELRSKLGSAMSALPEKYQVVVKMYYMQDKTMKEIGTALGVNESRVSQIHKAALEKMQAAFAGAGIASAAAF
ncbi:MAG TPA: FliA/WhiG family RNA polymerase sigma factor [Bryobacteraceae bacterium]|nr:FliA/WhiG family RNA polymerase sigma factor [Bryobacteraceae bacterium]